MNPLDRYPKVRAALYDVQWLTNLILGIIGIVLAALVISPLWWVIVQAVFNFVWSYTGITAKQNVEEPLEDVYIPDEYEPSQLGLWEG